jgi:hypothetical protein
MVLNITIKGNLAESPHQVRPELSHILQGIAQKIGDGVSMSDDAVKDRSGNVVGEWQLTFGSK